MMETEPLTKNTKAACGFAENSCEAASGFSSSLHNRVNHIVAALRSGGGVLPLRLALPDAIACVAHRLRRLLPRR